MKVVIDVDNTLCEFSYILYEELNKINEDVALPIEWDHWDFYKDMGISDKEFYNAANRAQDRISECREIPGSKEITKALHDFGCEVIIASHRRSGNQSLLEKWLMNKQIKYDEIHISYNKTVLFDDESVKLVFDDSPIIINDSCNRNIYTIAIRKPWNKTLKRDRLFMVNNYINMRPNIHEILEMIGD